LTQPSLGGWAESSPIYWAASIPICDGLDFYGPDPT